jgi:hypothetical protein
MATTLYPSSEIQHQNLAKLNSKLGPAARNAESPRETWKTPETTHFSGRKWGRDDDPRWGRAGAS